MPKRTAGNDDLWDRLGDEWQAIDGIQADMRVYARWDTSGEGRAKITGLCVVHPSITSEELRAIPISRVAGLPAAAEHAMSQEEFLEALDPLRRRKEDSPDEFADRVAYYYRVFTQMSTRPAKQIAEHSDVPVGTVRGWIREARLRGKLPPGTRGKAG